MQSFTQQRNHRQSETLGRGLLSWSDDPQRAASSLLPSPKPASPIQASRPLHLHRPTHLHRHRHAPFFTGRPPHLLPGPTDLALRLPRRAPAPPSPSLRGAHARLDRRRRFRVPDSHGPGQEPRWDPRRSALRVPG